MTRYMAIEVERVDVSRGWVLIPKEEFEKHPEDKDELCEHLDAENNYESTEFTIDNTVEIEAPDGLAFDNSNWDFVNEHRVSDDFE